MNLVREARHVGLQINEQGQAYNRAISPMKAIGRRPAGQAASRLAHHGSGHRLGVVSLAGGDRPALGTQPERSEIDHRAVCFCCAGRTAIAAASEAAQSANNTERLANSFQPRMGTNKHQCRPARVRADSPALEIIEQGVIHLTAEGLLTRMNSCRFVFIRGFQLH